MDDSPTDLEARLRRAFEQLRQPGDADETAVRRSIERAVGAVRAADPDPAPASGLRSDGVAPIEPGPVPIPRRASGRRRRTAVLAAACVALVAAAAGVAIENRPESRGRPPVAASSSPAVPTPATTSPIRMALGPSFALGFQVGQLPAGYLVVSEGVDVTQPTPVLSIGRDITKQCQSLASQSAPVVADREPACLAATAASEGRPVYLSTGVVFLLGAGQFDPAVMKGASRVEVNGTAGLLADVPAVSTLIPWRRTNASSPAIALTTLAWPYAPNRWAVVAWHNDTDSGVRELVTSIAQGLHVGSFPMSTPVTVGYLPPGIDRRDGLYVDPADRSAYIIFGGAPVGPHDHTLSVDVSPYALSDPLRPRFSGEKPITVEGRAARYSPLAGTNASELTIGCGAECTLTIQWGKAGSPEVEAELIKVAEHVTLVGDIDDPSSWAAATLALPH